MKQTIILPNKWNFFGFKEIPKYKELLWMFIWRDIKIRYKQTLLGIAWVLFQPIAMMIILTLFFGVLIKVPSDGLPYPVFFLSAYITWVIFYDGLMRSYASIVQNTAIITKVYFPRLIIPIAGSLAPLVDFTIAFTLLLVLILIYGLTIPYTIILVPILIVWAISLSFGVGAFMSALNVKYRDVQYAIPFLLMVWMYASPIVYPASLVPPHLHWVYYLNPVSWIIDGMRFALFGLPMSTQSVIPAITITGIIIVGGVMFFEYYENKFVDFI